MADVLDLNFLRIDNVHVEVLNTNDGGYVTWLSLPILSSTHMSSHRGRTAVSDREEDRLIIQLSPYL
jgi:hypothetical protein